VKETTEKLNRRAFLGKVGVGVLGVSFTPLLSCDSVSVEPITGGQEIPFITPISDFYEKVGAEVSIANWTQPVISKDQWSLEISGLVSSPLTISYADIEAEMALGSSVELLKTMRCVIDSNDIQGLVGTAIWRGVPLRTFLDRAGLDTAATKRLRLFGADSFTNNMTIDRVLNQPKPIYEPLLVTHMNGQELPQRFGGPVRLIMYETFGYKNIKWLTKVEATDQDDEFGTYQDAGFFDDGTMRLSSRITNPINQSSLAAGPIEIQGFAVSGGGPVEAVELVIDGLAVTAEIIPFSELENSELECYAWKSSHSDYGN